MTRQVITKYQSDDDDSGEAGNDSCDADDDPDDDDASTRTQLLALERHPDGDQTL